MSANGTSILTQNSEEANPFPPSILSSLPLPNPVPVTVNCVLTLSQQNTLKFFSLKNKDKINNVLLQPVWLSSTSVTSTAQPLKNGTSLYPRLFSRWWSVCLFLCSQTMSLDGSWAQSRVVYQMLRCSHPKHKFPVIGWLIDTGSHCASQSGEVTILLSQTTKNWKYRQAQHSRQPSGILL